MGDTLKKLDNLIHLAFNHWIAYKKINFEIFVL